MQYIGLEPWVIFLINTEREKEKVQLGQVWELYKAGEIERVGVYEGELKIGEIG